MSHMHGNGRRRVVVIHHPDFDQPGAEGVREAKAFAEQMLQGQQHMIEMAEESGEDLAAIEKVRQHTKAFRVLVRNLDEELI